MDNPALTKDEVVELVKQISKEVGDAIIDYTKLSPEEKDYYTTYNLLKEINDLGYEVVELKYPDNNKNNMDITVIPKLVAFDINIEDEQL